MGQLRSAVRALASTGLAPGPLLDALDGYCRRHEVGQMATLAYAQLHLGTRCLRFACAGHPPPVLMRQGEAPVLLWEGRSLPLDAFSVQAPRAEAAQTLQVGSVILLYTDGLIERRGQPLSEGLDRLLAEVAAERDQAPAALAPAVVRTLHDQAHADDVCLLAARIGETR